jgi:hypothetical protein
MRGLRCAHPGQRNAQNFRYSRPERQGSLHRLLDFRLASDEVALGFTALWLGSLRRPSLIGREYEWELMPLGLYKVVDTLGRSRQRNRHDRTANRAELAFAATHCCQCPRGRAGQTPSAPESSLRGMKSDRRTSHQTRCRQRRHSPRTSPIFHFRFSIFERSQFPQILHHRIQQIL